MKLVKLQYKKYIDSEDVSETTYAVDSEGWVYDYDTGFVLSYSIDEVKVDLESFFGYRDIEVLEEI
jgi:hypothetical protein